MSQVIVKAIASEIGRLLASDINSGYGGSVAFREKLDKNKTAVDIKGEFLFDIKGLEQRIAIANKGNKASLEDFKNRFESNFSDAATLRTAKKIIADAMAYAINKSKAQKEFSKIGSVDVVVVNSFSAATTIISNAFKRLESVSYRGSVQQAALAAILNVYSKVEYQDGDTTNPGSAKRVWDIQVGHLMSSSTVGRYNADYTYIANKLDTKAIYDKIAANTAIALNKRSQEAVAKRIDQVISSLAAGNRLVEYRQDLIKKNNRLDVQVDFAKAVGPKGIDAALSMEVVIVGPQAKQLNEAYGSLLGSNKDSDPIKNLVRRLEGEFTKIKSSPSIEELVENLVDQALNGKPKTTRTKTSAKVTTSIKEKTVKAKVALSKVKVPPLKIVSTNSGSGAKTRIRQGGKFTSLASVIAVINSELHDRIRANMGKGNAKAVLNYRTGRFANSVKLLKLDVSRPDAISVMYTYMKYPYQTFEPGFKQGAPASRDPRALIQKSIRQIINEKFAQELRYSFTRL